MRKRTKKQMYVIVFVITFVISTLIRISLLGSAPERLIQVIWNDDIGKIYKNLDYENANGNQYDLYVPAGLDKSKNQYLIVFIHGGSFNSGSKEDGEAEISKNEEDLITTTKKDSKNHGFGLKSIRKAVEKYDGSVVFGVQQNWFELKILLPRVL